MSALRSLLQLGGNETALSLRTVYVYHTSMDTTRNSNPGCCCLWTASSDVKWAAFETWGAGGDGGSGGAGIVHRVDVLHPMLWQYAASEAHAASCAGAATRVESHMIIS